MRAKRRGKPQILNQKTFDENCAFPLAEVANWCNTTFPSNKTDFGPISELENCFMLILESD